MAAKKRAKSVEMMDVTVMPASTTLTVKQILDVLKSEKDVQVFDADAVTGPDHIRLAFFHAEKAFREGRNLVRDRMLEVLLHAAASRQVDDAVNHIGLKNPEHIVIGFIGDTKKKKVILESLKAKEKKWKSIDKRAENKMIERMILLQLE